MGDSLKHFGETNWISLAKGYFNETARTFKPIIY